MLYKHYSEFEGEWRWPNFSIAKLACRHCGEYYHDPASLDKLQAARNILNKPMYINSGHRCIFWNAWNGGAPLSQHKKLALDISLHNQDRFQLLEVLRQVGFTTFGFYQTFIHTDIRPNRRWYSGDIARKLWKS